MVPEYILCSLLTGCIFIYSCENKIEDIKKFTEKKTAVEEARSVQSYLSQDGKLKPNSQHLHAAIRY
jgi:hypothetical protein